MAPLIKKSFRICLPNGHTLKWRTGEAVKEWFPELNLKLFDIYNLESIVMLNNRGESTVIALELFNNPLGGFKNVKKKK